MVSIENGLRAETARIFDTTESAAVTGKQGNDGLCVNLVDGTIVLVATQGDVWRYHALGDDLHRGGIVRGLDNPVGAERGEPADSCRQLYRAAEGNIQDGVY